jgi:hypothetical protein
MTTDECMHAMNATTLLGVKQLLGNIEPMDEAQAVALLKAREHVHDLCAMVHSEVTKIVDKKL